MTSLVIRIAGLKQTYPTFHAHLCRFFFMILCKEYTGLVNIPLQITKNKPPLMPKGVFAIFFYHLCSLLDKGKCGINVLFALYLLNNPYHLSKRNKYKTPQKGTYGRKSNIRFNLHFTNARKIAHQVPNPWDKIA